MISTSLYILGGQIRAELSRGRSEQVISNIGRQIGVELFRWLSYEAGDKLIQIPSQ